MIGTSHASTSPWSFRPDVGLTRFEGGHDGRAGIPHGQDDEAQLPPARGRVFDVRGSANRRRLPRGQQVPRREHHDRGHQPQAPRARHRPPHLGRRHRRRRRLRHHDRPARRPHADVLRGRRQPHDAVGGPGHGHHLRHHRPGPHICAERWQARLQLAAHHRGRQLRTVGRTQGGAGGA